MGMKQVTAKVRAATPLVIRLAASKLGKELFASLFRPLSHTCLGLTNPRNSLSCQGYHFRLL